MALHSEIKNEDYQALAEFRYHIRRFLRFSEHAARAAGLKPQQHQLLLALKGLPDGNRSTIGELAERLQIQHHSTVELVDRLVKRGLLLRKRGGADRREVMLQLTVKADKLLRELSLHHQEELRNTGPTLVASLRKMMNSGSRKAPKKTSSSKPASPPRRSGSKAEL